MPNTEINITPDKSLIKKLGMVGYRTEQAVAELIDNSIDARLGGMEQIDVRLDFKIGRIEVWDDGCGMDMDRLGDALTIAKETKDGEKLGQFGLGLKSACSSLGKAFTLVTSTEGSRCVFTAKYDEDRWLRDKSKDWTNFEVEEGKSKDNWHGTKISISKVKVPLYPNQLSNFRKRFGVRYGPYIRNKQVNIRVNSRDCKPIVPDVVDGTRCPIDITTPSGRLTGWVGLLARRSIKGDYGIHLYRNRRLISAFDKFGIRIHPEAAKMVGEISLNHVPVNFHKTGFLVESPEYQDAQHYFTENPIIKVVLRKASSPKEARQGIESVLSFDRSQTLPPLDARMSSDNASRLLSKAGRFEQKKDGKVFSFEFENSDVCNIRHVDDGMLISIGRKSGAFRLFKNPLFLIALLRIEAELVADDRTHQGFLERRNRMLEEFVAKRLPQQQNRGKPKKKAVRLSRYTLQDDLIEMHDYLEEHFEHEFQFTGISTLAPFLQNAYSRMVYSVYTINGAGQVLLDLIADEFGEFTALLNPEKRDFEVLFEATESAKFIAIREFERRPTPSWAEPEKAWLDLYFDVTRDKILPYHDELDPMLEDLLNVGLVAPARLRMLARGRKMLDEINERLPRE